jgi:ElaB/YqjD/DUF883 family membrane-anchored ribosome-binding protein
MAEETSELNQGSSEVDRDDFTSLTTGKTQEEMAPATFTENADGAADETEHIKAQIEETRSQMGETIDALQERLSYSNLSEQVSEHVNNAIETAKNSLYDATIGKAVEYMKDMGDGISDSTIVRTARNNPIPLILIGVGAGWLAYNFSTGGARRRNRRYAGMGRDKFGDRERARRDMERGTSVDLTERDREEESMLGSFSNKASTVKDRVSNAANSAYENASNAANSAYESASNAMGSAMSGAKNLANRAATKAGEYGNAAYDTYDHYITENPLAVGAAAFALGAVVGLAIPSTDYEGELMGETRDELFRKAQDKGSQLLDKTRHLVDEAANTVSKESRSIIH